MSKVKEAITAYWGDRCPSLFEEQNSMPNYFYYFTVYDTDGSVLTSGKYEINTEDEGD